MTLTRQLRHKARHTPQVCTCPEWWIADFAVLADADEETPGPHHNRRCPLFRVPVTYSSIDITEVAMPDHQSPPRKHPRAKPPPPAPPRSQLVALLEKRPTETVTGLALAGTVYGFLTQAGVAQPVAAVIAVVIAFGPIAVSTVVDVVRKP